MDPSVLDRLCLGDHVCRVYGDEDQRMATVADFVRAGARSDHKVVFFCVESPDSVVRELTARGVAVRALRDRGQLAVTAVRDGYLASGTFDPIRAIKGWRDEIAAARASGYAGLWAMGDMSWAAGNVSGAERLHWYELEVNRVFAGGEALALCLYDQRLFRGDVLGRLAAVHPSTLEPGDDDTWLPLLRMRRTSDPPGLKLSGEVDASNNAALAATLAGLADDLPRAGEPLTLDLTELRFADAAAGQSLIRAARDLPLRITGCSAPIARLLALLGGDDIPGVRAALVTRPRAAR